MGADMMIAAARAPRFTGAAKRELARVLADAVRSGIPNSWGRIVGEIAADRVVGNSIDPEDFSWHEEYLYDDPEHIYPEGQLQRWAAAAVRRVFERPREWEIAGFDGSEWLITGGLSWGDTPTDIFNEVGILDAYRIFNTRITVGEVLAAVRKIEGPQPVVEE